jgi:predicted RNase H-like HicB family nuclease
MRYAVVIEKVGNNFGAYVPDLPGCIVSGATMEEVEALIRKAVEINIEGMLKDNLPLSPSIAQPRYVEIGSNA